MITQQIDDNIKDAMRAKDSLKLSTLRAVKSEFVSATQRKGRESKTIDDLEALSIIRKCISQREDSSKAFFSGGRFDLSMKEQEEILILGEYLPVKMSDKELGGIVNNIIGEFRRAVGQVTKKDTGKIIKSVSEVVAGRADNKMISELVIKHLNTFEY